MVCALVPADGVVAVVVVAVVVAVVGVVAVPVERGRASLVPLGTTVLIAVLDVLQSKVLHLHYLTYHCF